MFLPLIANRGFVLAKTPVGAGSWSNVERIGRLVEAPRDVVELEAVELVL